jgi:uncharacterized protein (TIGR03382 family)
VATKVTGQVAPGEETTLRFKVLAPKAPGTVQTCFELRLQDNRFFDAAPLCGSVQVDPAPAPGDPAGEPSKATVRGGCSAAGAATPSAALLALLLLWRRRAPACATR